MKCCFIKEIFIKKMLCISLKIQKFLSNKFSCKSAPPLGHGKSGGVASVMKILWKSVQYTSSYKEPIDINCDFKIYAGLIEKVSMEETKGNADTTT